MLPSVTMETEASHMLEAALEQMDDIIAGSKATEFSSGLYDLGSPISAGPLQVVQLAEDLKLALELQPNQEERDNLRAQLSTETAQALVDWLYNRTVNLCSPINNETYQDRLLRLEGDKESLVLQVSVLTDQVEAQGEKIRDLESSLEQHHYKLLSTEGMLQQELLSRTCLETQRLDLMDEVSYLKLKMVGSDDSPPTHTSTHHHQINANMHQHQTNTNTHQHPPTNTNTQQQQQHQDPEGDKHNNKAECVVNLISELQEQMCKFQEEINTRIQEKRALEKRESQQGDLGVSQAWDQSPEVGLADPVPGLSGTDLEEYRLHSGQNVHDLMQELEQLKSKVEELEGEKSQYERKLRVTKTEISELQQLLAAKDAEIECLQNQLLSRGTAANDNAERDQEFQRLKMGMESLLASNDEKDRHIEELTVLLLQYRKMREIMALTHGSSEEELTSLKLRALTHKAHSLRSEVSSRGSSPFLLLSPSAFHRELDSSFSCHENMQNPSSSLISSGDPRLLNGAWIQTRILSSSLEELQSASSPKKCHLELNKYQTLPGKLRGGELRAELNGDREQYPSPGDLSPVHRDYSLRRTGAEKHEESFLSDQSPLSSGVESGQQSPVSTETKKTHRGIKKLWGRIRRSQSGSPVQVDDPELGEFRRGGFRATAGPRLARPGTTRDLKTPFSKWTTGQVCDWLDEVGLGQYGILAQHWVTSGQTLLSATTQDLEKEMGVKNPLHRKKLQLIVKTLSSKQTEKSSELDHVWVTRWLDDIGLPQYKDQFNQGRVDGRMLQHLTVNDLLFLRVSSQLHHLSIKCAIHVLHVNRFHPHCLKRRPSHENQYSPSEVVQWSNHRVMEWLRSVDLAEYAPNLRGSGVHGGLIILEPRFNSDTLAMLLNIPAQKTLLRRHLATNFSHLVGSPATLEKREFTEAAGHAPLNPTAKVKPKKLGFSTLTHLRRRRPDDSTDYICPLESPSPPQGSGQTQAAVNGSQTRPPYAAFRGLSPILDRETNGGDQVGLDDDDS